MGQSIHIKSYISFSSMRIVAPTQDKGLHVKDYGIFQWSGFANVTLDFKTSVGSGHFWQWGETKTIVNRLLSH